MEMYAPDAIHDFPFYLTGAVKRLGYKAIAAYMRQLPGLTQLGNSPICIAPRCNRYNRHNPMRDLLLIIASLGVLLAAIAALPLLKTRTRWTRRIRPQSSPSST